MASEDAFMSEIFVNSDKKFIKGQADIFSLVVEYLEKMGSAGVEIIPYVDILNQIKIYIESIMEESSAFKDGMKHAAEWFENYFNCDGTQQGIQLDDLRFIHNGIEERFHALWMHCLDECN